MYTDGSNYNKRTMKTHKYRHVTTLFAFLIGVSFSVLGQDTVSYRGILGGRLLYETIKLYPDKTFKWTSEYDLSWSEYGLYKFESENLTLDYYLSSEQPKTMTLIDTVKLFEKPIKTEKFIVGNDQLYRLNDRGEKIKRKKDKSIRPPWSWTSNYRHKYELIKE